MTGFLSIMLSLTANAAIIVPVETYDVMTSAGMELNIAKPVPRSTRTPSRRVARRSSRGRSSRRSRPKFQCSKCSEVFEFDPRTMGRGERGSERGPMGMGPIHPDCPKCDEKKSGRPMVRCPNTDCEKHYVSPRAAWEEAAMRGHRPPEGDPPKDICPHCKTDRREWYRKNRRRGRGRRRR